MSWRTYTDWLKHRQWALRVADRLGRGRGRMRCFDSLRRPPSAPLKPDLSNWQSLDLAAVWIGHATVLIRMAGLTILTDPVLSNRVGLGMGLLTVGPRRFFAPALRISELPPVDVILLSHAHFDHLDRPSLWRLPKRSHVVTAESTRDLVDDLGFSQVTELGWGGTVSIGELKIEAQEVRHWGARVFLDNHRGYNGYFLSGSGRRVLYAGDTAFGEHFQGKGRVDLAILGISAYDPYIAAHATPEQAWEMASHLPADHLLAIHHDTFRLSHEPMDEPMRRLLAAAGNQADAIVARQIGGMFKII